MGILLIAIITVFGINFFRNNITGEIVINEYYTYTKAICNESNYCQDYIIECNGEEIVSMKPITGAIIQHDENWQDSRNEKMINELCNITQD